MLAFVNLAQICSFSYPKVTRFTHPPLRSVHCDPPSQPSSLFSQVSFLKFVPSVAPLGTHFSHPYGANRSDSPPIHFIHYPSAGLSSISALLALRQVSCFSPQVSHLQSQHLFLQLPHWAPTSVTPTGQILPIHHLRATRASSSLLLQPSSLFSQVSQVSHLKFQVSYWPSCLPVTR